VAFAEENVTGRNAAPFPPLAPALIASAAPPPPAIPAFPSSHEIWTKARREVEAMTAVSSSHERAVPPGDPLDRHNWSFAPASGVQVSSSPLSRDRPQRGSTGGAQVSQAILRRFPFIPIKDPNADLPGPPSADNELVVLPELPVVGRPAPGIDRAVEEAQRAARTEAFTWKDGGTIMQIKGKKVTLELKVVPSRWNPGSFDLLSLSW